MLSTLIDAATPLVNLGFEYNEHLRANHLHKEAILQTLRVHEAETQASKEYHRVEVKQSNDQHARELLQAKVQHEENIDSERRSAIRENLRDEWSQITEKAETVLIVNTLILGVAFTMLIEGPLPDEMILEYPVLAQVYTSSLSLCLATLLLSVRYSMVLRFRVGRTIVNEMRTAIHRALNLDRRFRLSEQYQQCNRAKLAIAACDDITHPTRLKKVQSLPRQVAIANEVRNFAKNAQEGTSSKAGVGGGGLSSSSASSRRNKNRSYHIREAPRLRANRFADRPAPEAIRSGTSGVFSTKKWAAKGATADHETEQARAPAGSTKQMPELVDVSNYSSGSSSSLAGATAAAGLPASASADANSQGGGNTSFDSFPEDGEDEDAGLSSDADSDGTVFESEFGSMLMHTSNLGGPELGYESLDWVQKNMGYRYPAFSCPRRGRAASTPRRSRATHSGGAVGGGAQPALAGGSRASRGRNKTATAGSGHRSKNAQIFTEGRHRASPDPSPVEIASNNSSRSTASLVVGRPRLHRTQTIGQLFFNLPTTSEPSKGTTAPSTTAPSPVDRVFSHSRAPTGGKQQEDNPAIERTRSHEIALVSAFSKAGGKAKRGLTGVVVGGPSSLQAQPAGARESAAEGTDHRGDGSLELIRMSGGSRAAAEQIGGASSSSAAAFGISKTMQINFPSDHKFHRAETPESPSSNTDNGPSVVQTPTNARGVKEDTRRAKALERELHDIEKSYQGLLDVRLWQDKFLSKKLDLLRRNWCKPYDTVSQSCFMIGTWILLLCAALLVFSRSKTRMVRPLQYKFGTSTVAVSFCTMSAITVGGLVLLEGLLKRRHRYESAVRKYREQVYAAHKEDPVQYPPITNARGGLNSWRWGGNILANVGGGFFGAPAAPVVPRLAPGDEEVDHGVYGNSSVSPPSLSMRGGGAEMTLEYTPIEEIDREFRYLENSVRFDTLPYRFTPGLLGVLVFVALVFATIDGLREASHHLSVADEAFVHSHSSSTFSGEEDVTGVDYYQYDAEPLLESSASRRALVAVGGSGLHFRRAGSGTSPEVDVFAKGTTYRDVCALGVGESSFAALLLSATSSSGGSHLRVFEKDGTPSGVTQKSLSNVQWPTFRAEETPVAMGCITVASSIAAAELGVEAAAVSLGASSSGSSNTTANITLRVLSGSGGRFVGTANAAATNSNHTVLQQTLLTSWPAFEEAAAITASSAYSSPAMVYSVFPTRVYLAAADGATTAGYLVEAAFYNDTSMLPSSTPSDPTSVSITQPRSSRYLFVPTGSFSLKTAVLNGAFADGSVQKMQPLTGPAAAGAAKFALVLDVEMPFSLLVENTEVAWMKNVDDKTAQRGLLRAESSSDVRFLNADHSFAKYDRTAYAFDAVA